MLKKSLAALCLSALLLTSCGSTPNDSVSNKNNTSTPNSTSETKVDVVEMKEQDNSRLKKDESGNYVVESLPQFSEMEAGEEYAIMSTTMGDIKIRFFPAAAPNAVNNFIIHAKNGYYDGIIFHRVIPNFMIQGGDPDGLGTGGDSIWGKPFNDEFAPDMLNFGGSLSMANSGPNTNGSQFFINLNVKLPEKYFPQLEKAGFSEVAIEKYKEVGGNPHLDMKHTVFGQIFEGMDVVNAIALAETDSGNKPIEPIKIKGITFENYKYEKK